MFLYRDVSIRRTGHDGFRLEKGPVCIYVDPFKLDPSLVKAATAVLITHEHFDHLSIEDLQKVVSPETIIVCHPQSRAALDKIKYGEVRVLRPGESTELAGVKVTAVPAYNTNKYRDPVTKLVYHPKEDGKLGYLIDMGGTRIYHAGDTDDIPEMEEIACDVALLPVSGTYVMTAEEAAEAARKIAPKVAIPMHYGSIVGEEADAQTFAKLLEGTGIDVEILAAG